jgi:signal transduction histidine kinase
MPRRGNSAEATPVASNFELAVASAPGFTERLDRWLLTHTPLGALVRWVARIPAPIHAKLLAAFLLVTLLFFAMGAISVEMIASMLRQTRLLDEAHARVDASRHVEHALAMQMNFTAMALLLKDEVTIGKILRENNRFNSTLARIEQAAPTEEREIIQRIRAVQEEVLTTVADIANLLRDGKAAEAMTLQQQTGYPLYERIEALVTAMVKLEETRMDRLRQSVETAHRRAIVVIGAFIIASILLALSLGFVISWSLILPVREVDRFLGHLAKGDFSPTMRVPNRDELGRLVASMNQMSRELSALYEEQRQTAQRLGGLNQQLEAVSRAKSDFLARMSHELRTPMNAILGFTELLLDNVYGELPPSLREPLADIHTNGRHLLHLINDVLDLSKIEAGRMELALGEYFVADVVATVQTSLRSLAAEKGLEFEATTQADIPAAFGDGKRIIQCLMNLAGNAIKFTPQGRVSIQAERSGDTLLYRVSDTGVGIPKDQIENIFAEFQQADAAISRDFGGTGLGLSIAKKFVEMHGGRIWVESEVGAGSTFFFSIPLRVEERKT